VGNLDFPFRFAGNLRLRHDAVASFPNENLHFQVQMVSHFLISSFHPAGTASSQTRWWA
jgi:hypothetical protein